MAFPQTPLDLQVDLMIDGAWTDITSDVYARDQIRITRGRADEGRDVDPGRCSLTLNNRTGKYSPRNPLSTYYGKIGRNTPIRVSANAGDSYLDLPGGADRSTTVDHASLDITGDIDIRLGALLETWQSGAIQVLASKYNITGNQRSWVIYADTAGQVGLRWSADGINPLQAVSTAPVQAPPHSQLAIRATLDVNNGSGGNTATFYTSDSISGTWTQLGDPVVAVGTTSLFSSSAALEVGAGSGIAGAFGPPSGDVYAFELRNGIAGSVVANPDFTAQAAGTTSFADGAGRTWTLAGAATITNRKTRFVGEVVAWPIKWDTSGSDIYTPIEAAGILRRLGQGARPLDSTLRRRIPSFSPLAYWPMEDAASSTRAASALPGGRPLYTLTMDFAADDSLAGSKALPTVTTGSRLNGSVPSGTVTTEWHTEFIYNLPTAPGAQTTILGYWSTGTVNKWYLALQSGTATIQGTDATGALIVNQAVGIGTDLFGQWNRWQLYATQDGANVDWQVVWVNIDPLGGGGAFSGTYAGTVGRITDVVGPPSGYAAAADGLRLGHIAVLEDAGTTAYNFADHGFDGDTAGERISRLAEEEDVSVFVYGIPADLEPMGPQRPNTFLTLLREAADSDHGILYEACGAARLAYRDRIGMYNQTPAASLVYTTDLMPPLEPVDDDQSVRNDVTVQRINGSYGYARLDTGPLSVLAPPDGVGRYEESVSLSLYTDDQAPQHAGWLLHLGTVDEPRYPVVNVSLQAAPAMIETVAAVDIGDRMQITSTPTKLPPSDIDLIVQGYTETLSQFVWDLQFNCTPASPYTVAVDGEDPRADTDGSELAEDLTTTETAMDVAITAGPLWTTSGSQLPFDVLVGGERMTVTAISGASSPQTFTVTRSVNGIVKTHTTGADVRLYQPAIAAL